MNPIEMKVEHVVQAYRPLLSFSQRKKKKKNHDAHFTKSLDMVKHLHINISLVEVVEHMSNYVKFFKDILIKKHILG